MPGEQGCQHILGEILFVFLPSAISLWFSGQQLASYLEEKFLFQVWGLDLPLPKLGLLACSFVSAPGEAWH